MIDTTLTMRELCEAEPMLEGFLVAKGFPFSLDNPIVDLVTFDDVAEVQELDRDAFLMEFEAYKAAGGVLEGGTRGAGGVTLTATARAMSGFGV